MESAPMGERRMLTDRLPSFPWDRLAPYKRKAAEHADGIVDLSVGTPVDPVPVTLRRALADAADSPGYPQTWGTPELRASIQGWLARRHGVYVAEGAVMPTIGTKETVAWLPTLLGLGEGDTVVHPELAYPTYDVGARLAGATPVAADGLASLGPARVSLVWVNSPSNPTGRVLGVPHLRKVVQWARERGAIVISDECYLDLGWEGTEPVSILHPDVCDGTHENLIALHSLSKRSNLAGYRAAFMAGDPALVEELLEVRKHAGMIVPAPVQGAMKAALDADTHAAEQKERYRARRERLRAALRDAGWDIEHSEAGLYLWASRPGTDAWGAVTELAEHGILVAPGDFYGPAGAGSVRVAFTATDERVEAAAERLAS